MSTPLNDWEQKAQKGRDILENSIPKQWLLPDSKLPPQTQLNVIDSVKDSGALSEHELAITELSATELVRRMGHQKLTAEEVVVAFLKRAVLGHQLVCSMLSFPSSALLGVQPRQCKCYPWVELQVELTFTAF